MLTFAIDLGIVAARKVNTLEAARCFLARLDDGVLGILATLVYDQGVARRYFADLVIVYVEGGLDSRFFRCHYNNFVVCIVVGRANAVGIAYYECRT